MLPLASLAVKTTAELLANVASALNACEQAGLTVNNLAHGAVETSAGYVVPFGDPRIGCRWVVRARIRPDCAHLHSVQGPGCPYCTRSRR